MILSFITIVFALACLIYSIHVAVVFHRFNEGIKDWAFHLDDNINSAINRAARNILMELDRKVSSQNEEYQENNENVKPLNFEKNECGN